MAFDGHVWIHDGQLYLSGNPHGSPDWDRCFTANPVGIVGVYGGEAILLTGLHTGHVGIRVDVAAADPGAQLERYEDVVEIDFVPTEDELHLVEWAGEDSHPLGALPKGPGNHRLRYHARGMDAGHDLDTADEHEDEIVDEYLVQVWPARPSMPATLKLTSAYARACQNA